MYYCAGQLTHDLTPVLFVDLIQHYDQLLPPTLAKKQRESERKIPRRNRTAMINMWMRRSNIGDISDLKEAIIHQNTRRTGPGSRSSISTTTGPPESVKAMTSRQQGEPSISRTEGGQQTIFPFLHIHTSSHRALLLRSLLPHPRPRSRRNPSL